jgi:DNA topoisomerase-3
MEQQLNLIASGKASFGEVLEYFLDMFSKKFSYFTKQVRNLHVSIAFLY